MIRPVHPFSSETPSQQRRADTSTCEPSRFLAIPSNASILSRVLDPKPAASCSFVRSPSRNLEGSTPSTSHPRTTTQSHRPTDATADGTPADIALRAATVTQPKHHPSPLGRQLTRPDRFEPALGTPPPCDLTPDTAHVRPLSLCPKRPVGAMYVHVNIQTHIRTYSVHACSCLLPQPAGETKAGAGGPVRIRTRERAP